MTAQLGAPVAQVVIGTPTPTPQRTQWKALLYIAPAFTVMALFLMLPFLQSVYLSFFDWNGITEAKFAGLDNYGDLFTQPVLRQSFGHAAILVFFFAVLPVALALFLTAMIGRAARLRGAGFFRTVLFLPQVIASVVVATTWTAIYAPGGLWSSIVSLFGGSEDTAWLGDFGTALPAIGLIGTWVEIGLCLVLFTAGASQIPTDRYDAARVDGASAVREFFAVTLPGLRGQIAVALTLTVVAGLKTFDLVYVTTRGGPGNATSVPSFQAYNLAFNVGRVGAAAAIGVALAVVIAVVTLAITAIGRQGDES